MTLEALIFDVDGTLAETEEAHRAAFNRTFAAHGIDWDWSREDYRWLLNTTGGKERIRAHAEKVGKTLDDGFIRDLHARKWIFALCSRFCDLARQAHDENGTGAGRAFKADAAPHGGNDPLDDRQAEPTAACNGSTGLLEFREDALLIPWRDTRAGVANFHDQLAGPAAAFMLPAANNGHASLLGELYGVSDKIGQDLTQSAAILPHRLRHFGGNKGSQAQTLCMGTNSQQLGDFPNDVPRA